jgi:hypothetical protein
MVIVNGEIQGKITAGGGLDEKGNPSPVLETLSEQLQCRIKANKRNDIGKHDGNTFTVASYEVLTEGQYFENEIVILTDAKGKFLGEFPVISCEYLEAVGLFKILV